jgi:hypothetical protein
MCVPMFIRTACQLRIMRIIIKVLGTNGRKLQGIYCDCSLSQREAFADAKLLGHEDLILTP